MCTNIKYAPNSCRDFKDHSLMYTNIKQSTLAYFSIITFGDNKISYRQKHQQKKMIRQQMQNSRYKYVLVQIHRRPQTMYQNLAANQLSSISPSTYVSSLYTCLIRSLPPAACYLCKNFCSQIWVRNVTRKRYHLQLHVFICNRIKS